MQFAILGAGSLGLLWTGRLARAGHRVRLLMHTPEALQRWQARDSALVLEQDGQQQMFRIPAQLNSVADPFDCLIVATKAYAVAEALAPVYRRLALGGSVVMLQNGLGSQQYATQLCAPSQVLYASVTDGAWMPRPGHVVWAGTGITRIGDPSAGPCPAWLEELPVSVVDWCWETDMESVLWQKLAINCAINPYTVLHDCANGEVAERAGADLDALVAELQSLLVAQGFRGQATELPTLVSTVIQRTALNSSSMRQDVQAGRRTEIEYILGYACRAAARHGLETPTLRTLHRRLETHLAMLGLPTN